MHQILELNPLERIIADSIKDVISEVRTAAEYKREQGQYDQTLTYAEGFLREYQDCKWRGTATNSFKNNIKEHLMYAYRMGAIKKLLKFVAMAGAGMLTACIGYKMNEPAVGIAGDLIGIASVVITYISFRNARENMEKIYHTINTEEDTMNKILKHLDEEEKCQN